MNIQPTTNSARAFVPALPHKICAYCGSVFINDNACESCNRQFNKLTVAAPGSEKSFYVLQARYRRDVGRFLARFDQFLAKDASLRVRYLALLKKRFLNLLDLFNHPGQGALSAHAYLLEFRDLVIEMRRLGVDIEYVYDMVELNEGSLLMPQLRQTLDEVYASYGRGMLSRWWRHRLGDGPRIGFLLSLIVAYGSLCASALWLFSYLAKR